MMPYACRDDDGTQLLQVDEPTGKKQGEWFSPIGGYLCGRTSDCAEGMALLAAIFPVGVRKGQCVKVGRLVEVK